MRINRRRLQIAVGLLWLADGLLQLQPFMFTSGFAHEILAPAGAGQPGWVAAPVHYFAAHFAQHPALFNSAAAAFQLALGAGFLLQRTVRIAVVGSIAWSVAIWWFGEGLNGLASGHATLITGAPGAAILYGMLAAGSWPRDPTTPSDWRDRPARWLTWAWTTIWVGGAVLQLLPAQRGSGGLAEQLRRGADGAPRWLAATDRAAATAIGHAGTSGLFILAAVMAAVGIGVLIPGRIRTGAGYTGAGLATVFWLVGQDLGELYSGQATDPNSAVLLIVFAAAMSATTASSAPKPPSQPAAHRRPRPNPVRATYVAGARRPMPVRP